MLKNVAKSRRPRKKQMKEIRRKDKDAKLKAKYVRKHKREKENLLAVQTF